MPSNDGYSNTTSSSSKEDRWARTSRIYCTWVPLKGQVHPYTLRESNQHTLFDGSVLHQHSTHVLTTRHDISTVDCALGHAYARNSLDKDSAVLNVVACHCCTYGKEQREWRCRVCGSSPIDPHQVRSLTVTADFYVYIPAGLIPLMYTSAPLDRLSSIRRCGDAQPQFAISTSTTSTRCTRHPRLEPQFCPSTPFASTICIAPSRLDSGRCS